ncbi:MAG: 7-cyano-7-deazaguanine synthase QueC [Sphaerochaetaceae bacterium]|nr:7-cyano-7-deazaguanine synthase QueC [Sphaerochaetaceae bacterium]
MRQVYDHKCIVALSGGQDSATVLSWAKNKFSEIFAVSFNYGQRHKKELDCAKKLAELADVKEHIIIDMTQLFSQVTRSSLLNKTDNISNPSEFDFSLPSSFVPFRNMQFLTQVTSIAYLKRIQNIATGVCQTDYSGYPDCRDSFIKALNVTLNLACDGEFIIHTPLMYLTKAETVKLMDSLGTLDWYEHTLTCYNGTNCGKCPSCLLRIKGFEEAGIKDPLIYE